MRGWGQMIVAAAALACPATALANASDGFGQPAAGGGRAELPPYLQCVPYARERSGVQIYGDALTWWDQAAGRYKRGFRPKPGAVMAFRPSGAMALGHVAAVARVIDSRTILLDHANWSPIDGRRGQVERGVKAVDVSPANDWSQVRVWYDPLKDLGTTAWPVAGFIYNERAGGTPDDRSLGGPSVLASAPLAPRAVQPPISDKPSKMFAAAFATLGQPRAAAAIAPARLIRAVRRVAVAARAPRDPIAQAVARYDR